VVGAPERHRDAEAHAAAKTAAVEGLHRRNTSPA
jgi:hypothetical protein